MRAGVIGKAIGGIDRLGIVLCKLKHMAKVLRNYTVRSKVFIAYALKLLNEPIVRRNIL
jgi:hypothetical protein